jgi:hypothetical protein
MPVSEATRLSEPTELLHRQVHPQFIRDGRVSSQAFKLNTQDKGLLSVTRDSKCSAQEAHRRYTARGRSSCGVWSVTVAECNSAGLQAYDDPLEDDDAHAVVDFNVLPSKGQLEKAAARLTEHARQRGRQYPP